MSAYTATNTISLLFNCSIERAFKTPILGDATKILLGFGNVPLVIGFKNDETWGKQGGSRIPITKKKIFSKSKPMGFDEIFIRDENNYWKWGVSKLPFPVFFASHNIGEWWVEIKNEKVIATWKYTWYAKNIFTQPFNWLFVKIYWRKVMKNGMNSIKKMAEEEWPYLYS